jgi:Leucine-rich repeat (LRR) protein
MVVLGGSREGSQTKEPKEPVKENAMKTTPPLILSVLFFLVLVTSCSGANQPNQQAPDFSLQLAVEQLSIKQGETGTLRITIQKTGAFTTAVGLSLAGNPAGVTATFNPASTSDESTLTLNVAASAAAGESTLTITGTAGDIVKTATLQLTVIENITLELTIAGLPAGVAANVVMTGPNAFQQTLSASTTFSQLAPGTYTFTVNEVKPDSATFSKISGPNDLEFTGQQDESVTLTYGCSLVTPPDANLDTLLRAVTGKDTYACADLAALTQLTASNKSIQNIESLQYASGLTELFLDNNQLTSLSKSIFDQLTALTHLELFGNQLTSLPAGVFDNLTALTILSLGQNQLTSLPSGIFDNLTSLTSLSLLLNQLSSFPIGIFDNLTALKFLSLDRNQLSGLTSGTFDKLTALTDLTLHQNQLTSLPTGIFDRLTALTSLTLFSNQLSTLPVGIFDNLTSLTTLILSQNQLSGLPSGIFANSTSLTGLALNDNQLSSLPDGLFDNLSLLSELDLSNNQLTNLPLGIFDSLSASTELILEANCLELAKVPTKGYLAAVEAQVQTVVTDDNPKAGCAAVPQAVTFSTFDTNAEGWTVLGDGTNLIHVATGGNPGGFIQATDGGQGSTWYWKAPSLYYGDARDYIGKTLNFSLKQSATDSGFDDVDVILRNSNFASILVADIAAPGVGFTDYEITLTGDNFNFTDNAFAQMLENLTSIEIRGEYRTGADTGGLDSVSFGE